MAWTEWIGTREGLVQATIGGGVKMTGMRETVLGWEGNDGADASVFGGKWRDQGSYLVVLVRTWEDRWLTIIYY